MTGDVAYLIRRASEEREAAMRAAHPNARQAHLQLAGRYREMADAITAREQHWAGERKDGPLDPLSA